MLFQLLQDDSVCLRLSFSRPMPDGCGKNTRIRLKQETEKRPLALVNRIRLLFKTRIILMGQKYFSFQRPATW